jgi:ribonuclease P protein component
MRSPRSLTATSEFQAVFRNGHRARRDGLTVWALRSPSRAEPRLGLAVGTSVGGAVVRNRIRRQLRALVRGLPLAGVDLVVKADRSASRLSFQEMESHLRAAVAESGARLQ